MQQPYPWLSPELRALPGDARRLWGDAEERRRAIRAIVETMGLGGNQAKHAVRRVDDAVRVGLRACGLPRGPVRGPVIAAGIGPSGRKRPDCTLEIFGDQMREVLRDANGADSIFRTWVHESIHARQPFAPRHRLEYDRFEGYEEGLAEGLARLLVRDQAGMHPHVESYRSYVAAYESLATVVGVSPERLWRRLWERPLGSVRGAFVDAVDALWRDVTGRRLTRRQRQTLQGLADQRFDSKNHRADAPDAGALVDLWRIVFR